jgi:hypothetical protein
MTAIERQKQFMAWIYDLEWRLAVHLCEHSDDPAPVTALAIRGPVLPDDPREIIEVREREPGWWAVLRNGLEVAGFFGVDSHARASKFASDILNPPESRSSGRANLDA